MSFKSLLSRYFLVFFILFAAILVISFFAIRSPGLMAEQDTEVLEESVPEIMYDEYGIEKDVYYVDASVVRNRQTLGHILGQMDFGAQFIDRIVREMTEHFDPRRVRAGNSYHVYRTNDTLQDIQYFIYDISALDFLKIDLTDSLVVSRGEKEVTTFAKTASGVINSSLWVTLTQNNLNPLH